jgi:hypothetical protein
LETMTTDIGTAKREALLARLEAAGGDLEDIAEDLAARDGPMCKEQILTCAHQLRRAIDDMGEVADEAWMLAEPRADAQAVRVDACAQENMRIARERLPVLLMAGRLGVSEIAYAIAQDIADHGRRCGDSVEMAVAA